MTTLPPGKYTICITWDNQLEVHDPVSRTLVLAMPLKDFRGFTAGSGHPREKRAAKRLSTQILETYHQGLN